MRDICCRARSVSAAASIASSETSLPRTLLAAFAQVAEGPEWPSPKSGQAKLAAIARLAVAAAAGSKFYATPHRPRVLMFGCQADIEDSAT